MYKSIQNTNLSLIFFKLLVLKTLIFLYIMKTKFEGSIQKFVRKNSKSPWDPNRYTLTSGQDHIINDHQDISARYNGTRNLVINQRRKQTPIKSLYEDRCPEKLAPKTFQHQIVYRSEVQTINHQKICQENNLKNHYDNKLLYINIQSVSTNESQPTMRKRASQNLNVQLITKRNQENQSLLDDMQRVLCQNRYLETIQNEKNFQIKKLSQQLQRSKNKSTVIQNQLNETKKLLWNVQGQLTVSKMTCENLKAELQTKQLLKSTAQQKVKETSLMLSKLDLEIRQHCLQKNQLLKIIQNLKNQVKKSKKQEQYNIKQITAQKQHNRNTRDDPLKSHRSQSIQNSYFSPQKSKAIIIHTQQHGKRNDLKYNRYVQTQNSNIQQILKQNQKLKASLKKRDTNAKQMQKFINVKEIEIRNLQWTRQRLQESEKLVQALNQKIMTNEAAKLSAKYKYY